MRETGMERSPSELVRLVRGGVALSVIRATVVRLRGVRVEPNRRLGTFSLKIRKASSAQKLRLMPHAVLEIGSDDSYVSSMGFGWSLKCHLPGMTSRPGSVLHVNMGLVSRCRFWHHPFVSVGYDGSSSTTQSTQGSGPSGTDHDVVKALSTAAPLLAPSRK